MVRRHGSNTPGVGFDISVCACNMSAYTPIVKCRGNAIATASAMPFQECNCLTLRRAARHTIQFYDQCLAPGRSSAIVDICVELLGVPRRTVMVEFTPHPGEEILRDGNWAADWTPAEAATSKCTPL